MKYRGTHREFKTALYRNILEATMFVLNSRGQSREKECHILGVSDKKSRT